MKTIVFPGQGSQVKGMGAGLFERFPQHVRRADEILGYSIRELCLEDPRRELGLTQFTQPAIYVVSALSWFKRQEEGGAAPDYFAGHSLGEYNALLAAGSFDFDVGLTLVKKRGELIGQVKGGGMAAILGATRAQVASILQQSGIDGIDLAIQNSPSQCVLAGRKQDLDRVEPFFRDPPFSFHPLNTSGAFHSRYMKDVGEEFGRFLADVKLESPRIPVIANVTARPYEPGKVAQLLVAQISQPVRWSESIEYLLSLGDFQFEEVGYGEVLTRIVRTITASRPPVTANARPTPPAPPPATVIKPPPAEKAKPSNAGEKVAQWNSRYPVGTSVRSEVVRDKVLETRTEAMVLFGHRAAVYLRGYEGYFDLDQIEAVQSARP